MKAFFCVILMAVTTYIIRALPITILRKEIKSQFLQSFLYYVPYAVLASLTFPAIFSSTGNMATGILGTIAALILAYMEKGLVLVAVLAILIVYFSAFFL